MRLQCGKVLQFGIRRRCYNNAMSAYRKARPEKREAVSSNWTQADTSRAIQIWSQYQQQHDVAGLIGQTAGIDPASGRVWFGDSATDIWEQMDAQGIETPLYYVRVGSDYYVRKGGRR